MWNMRRLLVWLGRMRHSRGFGVQSPWAYRMVRYVINEHWPYYAYGELTAAHPSLDKRTRRLCELVFRLTNSVQPRRVVAFGPVGAAYGSYVRAGCRRAEYLPIPSGGCLDGMSGADMAVMSPCGDIASAFTRFSRDAGDGSVAMLIDIRRDKSVRRLWREVAAGMPGVVTFDLYYCGLVFFDKKRYKQNYIINF